MDDKDTLELLRAAANELSKNYERGGISYNLIYHIYAFIDRAEEAKQAPDVERDAAQSATPAIERAIQEIYAAVHIWDRGHGRVSYKVEGEKFKLALDRLAELVSPVSSGSEREGQDGA